MKEYDIYVPSRYNDGRPVEAEKLSRLKARLVKQFGGLTFFPQENEGMWKVGRVSFRDKIMILRVVANDGSASDQFFAALKPQLKSDFEQEEILIIAREVAII